MLMSDSQQPGAAGDDQVPPIPPAPAADVPPVPPAPAAPDAPAEAAPASAPADAAPEPYAAPEPTNPYAPPATNVPSSAPVPPVAPAAPNPYAAPAAPAAAAAPAANPYAAPANPYAAPAGPGGGAPGYATPAYAAGPTGPSRFNVMGLVSLILGGVAFLFGVTIGWVPYVGFFFVFLALVGVILGIVGLIVKNKAKGLAIAGTIVSGVALLATAIISILMLTVVLSFQNSYDDFGPDDPVITDPDGGSSGSDSDDPNALGSQNNPAAVGDTVTFTDYDGVDQWSVVLGTPNLDATADVMGAYEYNTEPEPGNVYVVVPMTVTYLGEGTDVPYMLFTEFVGGDGQSYDLGYAQYPGSIYDAEELATGETAEVNLVFEVPSGATSGALVQISSIWGNDIFVALD